MSTNNGGPAFPALEDADTDWGGRGAAPGMSLRDYFAAKAMATLLGDPAYTDDWNKAALCDDAYAIADAMLAKREKK